MVYSRPGDGLGKVSSCSLAGSTSAMNSPLSPPALSPHTIQESRKLLPPFYHLPGARIMKIIGSILAALALAGLLTTLSAADEKKVEKPKLVGKWKVTKAPDDFPPKAIIEFTKDDKIKASFEADG